MYTKKNTRVTFRSNRRPNFKRNSNFSNNKPRNKGNVTQQYNKYLKMAKEASSSGDRIQSEYYYQFTDHYYRLMLELGIDLDNSENQEDRHTEERLEDISNSSNQELNENNSDEVEESSDSNISSESTSEDKDIDSIVSVPFIAEPIKKKTTRVKKVKA